MITRIEYTSRNMERRAIIERNDSGEAREPWDLVMSQMDRDCQNVVTSVAKLWIAQALARTWVNHR